VFDERDGSFAFSPGPIFANVVLADEINRAPPKTQAALLEAMEEGQVTVDGDTHALPDPFYVIATQNPVESEGAFPLPEAQLDRFTIKTSIGYPDEDGEIELLRRRAGRAEQAPTVDRVSTPTPSRRSGRCPNRSASTTTCSGIWPRWSARPATTAASTWASRPEAPSACSRPPAPRPSSPVGGSSLPTT